MFLQIVVEIESEEEEKNMPDLFFYKIAIKYNTIF